MKNVAIAAAVCIAILYGVDDLYYNGMYSKALSQTMSEIFSHFQ